MEETKANVSDVLGDLQESLSTSAAKVSESLDTSSSKVADAIGAVKEQAFGSPAAAASPLQGTKLDFGAKVATPATPATPFVPKMELGDDVDYNAFIKDTLLWTNKVRSAVYLLGGLLAILAAYAVFNSTTPLITAVCYVVLGQMALNFIRATASPKLQERATYADSAYTHWAIGQTTAVVRGAAVVHDSHLSTLQPQKTLEIIMGLWLLSILARYVSAFVLLAAVYALLFVVPKLYVMNKAKIDKLASDVSTKAKAKISTLDMRVKALLIVVPVLLLGYFNSRPDMIIAIFVVLAYARTHFKQSEVEAHVKTISDKTQFITKTASKVSVKISNAVGTFADKHELTPTPTKKKTQ